MIISCEAPAADSNSPHLKLPGLVIEINATTISTSEMKPGSKPQTWKRNAWGTDYSGFDNSRMDGNEKTVSLFWMIPTDRQKIESMPSKSRFKANISFGYEDLYFHDSAQVISEATYGCKKL